MSDNEDLKKGLTKTLDILDALIVRENQAAVASKMATDAALKLEALEGKIRDAEAKLKDLNAVKSTILEDAQKQADEIVAKASDLQKMVEDRASELKRLEQRAQEKFEEAKNTLATHQNALSEVLAQKEKMRAALAG